MNAQLSIKKNRLKLWLLSEQQSVQSEIKSIPNNNMCMADKLFELSVLEYKLEFIQKQISKLK